MACPFELVLAVYVLPFTVNEMIFPEIPFPLESVSVAVNDFVAVTVYVLAAAAKLVFSKIPSLFWIMTLFPYVTMERSL